MSALPPLPEVPFVSVLTVVYNHERFVAESIESVLAEGWPEDRFEHVIVDDGSTDRTADVIDRYRDHVRYIRQENQGVLAAVDRGIEELNGDVITGAGGDDAWRPGRLERLIGSLRQNPNAGLVYSDLEVIDADSKTLHPSFMAAHGLTPHRGRPLGKLLRHNFVSGGGCMIRGCLKPVIHPVPPHAAWEDWWWAWAVSSVADVEYLDEPTYRYRFHGDNLAFGATGEKLASAIRHELRFRRWTLATIEPGQATPVELVEGLITLFQGATRLHAQTGEPIEALLRPCPYLFRPTGDALFDCVRALAADPLEPTARERLSRQAPGAEAAVPVVAPTDVPEVETRSFVVVADADELVAQPHLLRDYGAFFSDADDATLVIIAAGWPRERLDAELPPLVAHAGLDGPAAPDMLGLPAVAGQAAALARSADAWLEPGTGIESLRAHAERHWKQAA